MYVAFDDCSHNQEAQDLVTDLNRKAGNNIYGVVVVVALEHVGKNGQFCWLAYSGGLWASI